MSEFILVLSNFPDRASAEQATDALLEQKLVACVTILAESLSVYRWEGQVERAREIPVMIKTTAAAYPELEKVLRQNHPYDLPEIIALPIMFGLPDYLNWINQSLPARNQV